MLDDIKLSAFSSPKAGQSQPSTRSLAKETNQAPAADVNVTPKLSKLANALSESDESTCPKRAGKLATLKTLLNNDEYKVDMNTLAKRLSQCSLMN